MTQKVVAIVPRQFTFSVPDGCSQDELIANALEQIDSDNLGVGERVEGELPESIQLADAEGSAIDDAYLWFDADGNPQNGTGLPPGYDALHTFATRIANLEIDKNPRAVLIELQSWAQQLVGTV